MTTCRPALGDEPQHVHLASYDNWGWSTYQVGDTIYHNLVQDSPYNVFRDLYVGVNEEYDYPEFTSVELPGGGETGIVFFLDESPDQYLQGSIFGAVDMLVSAVNSFFDAPPRQYDYCCVGAIRYRILNWNTYDEQYEPTSLPWRIVFDMWGFLPGDSDPTAFTDEFLRIYKWNGSKFNNIQCITNCGVLNEVDSCLQNVWVDAYSRQDSELCRGAWDTRIINNGDTVTANSNRYALFKDGRYAIELEAISQRDTSSILDTLPVSDITDPNYQDDVTGIVVDNYYPFIEEYGLYWLYESNYTWLLAGCCYPVHLNNPDPPTGPDRYWSGNFSGYTPPSCEQYDLALTVITSEVAEFDNSGVNWHLETKIGDSTTWEDDISFTLDEWDPNLFPPDGTVALYTAPMCALPEEYTGRIEATLTFDNIATDLAGNHLDMDPITWMSPRDEITGQWDLSEYEDTQWSVTKTWRAASDYIPIFPEAHSAPCWIGPDRWIQGYADDYVIDVYIDEPVYPWDTLLGDCPWLCGFWVYINGNQPLHPFGYDGTIGAYAVDCEGNILSFPDQYSGEEVRNSIWYEGFQIGCDGKIAWITFLDHDPLGPDSALIRHTNMYAAAYNAENGEWSGPIYLGTGYTWAFLFPPPWENRNTLCKAIALTDSGDVTIQTIAYEVLAPVEPVISDTTISCPWQMSGDNLALSDNTEF